MDPFETGVHLGVQMDTCLWGTPGRRNRGCQSWQPVSSLWQPWDLSPMLRKDPTTGVTSSLLIHRLDVETQNSREEGLREIKLLDEVAQQRVAREALP